MEEILTDVEVKKALEQLSGWETMGWKATEEIRKTYKFPSFTEAWEFVRHFVTIAKGMEAHVNLEIYRPGSKGHVPVRVSLGYGGRVTPEDLDLAQRIETELTPS